MTETNVRGANVTRFEVIDHRTGAQPFGRVFSAWDCRIELSYQDAGCTLKVFVDGEAPHATPIVDHLRGPEQSDGEAAAEDATWD